jgi:hypothetical protein
MPLVFTPIASDLFQRANESPLESPWEVISGGNGMQVVSDLCVPAGGNSSSNFELYNISTPNDQYCTIIVNSLPSDDATLVVGVRQTNVSIFGYGRGYMLQFFPGTWTLTNHTNPAVSLGGGNWTLSANDTVTLGIVGTEIFIIHNGVQIFATTNATYSSGLTAIGAQAGFSTSGAISSFVMGSLTGAPLPSVTQSSFVYGATETAEATMGLPTAVGNSIVVCISVANTNPSSVTISSVTDDASGGSNTYVLVPNSAIVGVDYVTMVYWCANARAASHVTVVLGENLTGLNIGVLEVNGISLATPIAGTTVTISTGVTFNGPSMSTTSTGFYLVSSAAFTEISGNHSNPESVGSPWTLLNAGQQGTMTVAVTTGTGTQQATYSNAATGNNYAGVLSGVVFAVPVVSTPTFSPSAGAVAVSTVVTVSDSDSALPGFQMFYTKDGTTPTQSSTPYSAPLELDRLPAALKVLAIANGYGNSAIASAAYTLFGAIAPTPALPFTKRTTASVTVFACYQQAKVAQTITSNGDTVVALQIELGQLFSVYKQLQRQDVTNQVVTLDAAIKAAQVAILALNSTVQGMTVSGADNVKVLANIRSVVANAVGTIAAVVANE